MKQATSNRLWLTRAGGEVRGPFEAAALVSSLRARLLPSTAEVRPTDDPRWRPLSEVDLDELEPPPSHRPRMLHDPRAAIDPHPDRGQRRPRGRGFTLGFAVAVAVVALALLALSAALTHWRLF